MRAGEALIRKVGANFRASEKDIDAAVLKLTAAIASTDDRVRLVVDHFIAVVAFGEPPDRDYQAWLLARLRKRNPLTAEKKMLFIEREMTHG